MQREGRAESEGEAMGGPGAARGEGATGGLVRIVKKEKNK